MIAAFSSMAFLLVSVGGSIANLRLRKTTKSKIWLIYPGLLLMISTIILLVIYLWESNRETLTWILFFYIAVIVTELLFSKRMIFFKHNK